MQRQAANRAALCCKMLRGPIARLHAIYGRLDGNSDKRLGRPDASGCTGTWPCLKRGKTSIVPEAKNSSSAGAAKRLANEPSDASGSRRPRRAPHSADLLPDALVQILETPSARRSKQQSDELARYYREEVDPVSAK